MISADDLTKLLIGSFPVIVIVTAVIYAVTKIRKERHDNYDTTPSQLFGMRMPTDEEAHGINNQVIPRLRKTAIVMSLIFVPIVVVIAGVAVSLYTDGGEDSMFSVIMGFVALAFGSMYLCFLYMYLSEIYIIAKRRYTVSDCHIADIRTYIRYTRRGMPVKIYHATISDEIGLTWELDLPKPLQSSIIGDKCLVIIYDDEEKKNKVRTNGTPLYRRQLYVPRDYQ